MRLPAPGGRLRARARRRPRRGRVRYGSVPWKDLLSDVAKERGEDEPTADHTAGMAGRQRFEVIPARRYTRAMQWATFRLQDASSRARTGLILCGIASLAIWIAALFFHEAIGPLGGFIVRRTGVPGVGPVWLMLALFVPYLIAYRIVSRVEIPRARRIIIAFAALSCFVLAARIMPTASFDIYL